MYMLCQRACLYLLAASLASRQEVSRHILNLLVCEMAGNGASFKAYIHTLRRYIHTYVRTYVHTYIDTDRQTDRQAGRQAGRQTDKHDDMT